MKRIPWLLITLGALFAFVAQGPCPSPEQRVITVEYACAQGVDIFWEELYGPGRIVAVIDPDDFEDLQIWSRAYNEIGDPYGDPDAWESMVHNDMGPGGAEEAELSFSSAYAAPWEIRTRSDRAGTAVSG